MNQQTVESVVKIWSNIIPIQSTMINPQISSFEQLGGTRTKAESLFMQIGKQYGINLTVDDIGTNFTVFDIINLMDSKSSSEQTKLDYQPWLYPIIEQQTPTIKLFCLPYAGGNASIFNYWRTMNVPGASIYAIELPGRQARISESPYSDMEPLIESLSQFLAPHIKNCNYALLGNCIGSVTAFELAHSLRMLIGTEPVCLIASNSRAPHIPRPEAPIHALDRAELIDALAKMGATPPEVLANENLLNFLLPSLRADFAVIERYKYNEYLPLHCDIFTATGLDDAVVNEKHVDEWRKHTTGNFFKFVLPGDHNLLADQTTQLSTTIELLLQHIAKEHSTTKHQ